MKVDNISASGIKTYKQCPLKYYAVYDLELPKPPPHPNTVMGSALHSMMEMATKQRIQKGSDPARHDPMFWKQTAITTHKVEPHLHTLIDELVANAVRWGYFRNIHRTVGCEVAIDFHLPDGTPVTGFIDRLDLMLPDVDIIDLKTQKNDFEQDELDDNWQARIYNIGARRIRSEITGKATVSFWVLRHQVQRVTLTSKDAENDIGRIAKVVDEIRACKDPEGKPSGLCPWCPYDKQCPVKNSTARERFRKVKKR
jgi:putative RecB family exonuclease